MSPRNLARTMGIVSKYVPPDEGFYMKIQQLIHKVEELKALVNLYEQVAQGLAQAHAIMSSVPSSDEQDESLVSKVSEIETRYAHVRDLLIARTGAADESDAIEKVQEHMARLNHYQELRAEQLQLRTQLDLELVMGAVDPETRQQVENKLQSIQARLETLVRQGSDVLARPRLISLT
jgi:hypothetical protein